MAQLYRRKGGEVLVNTETANGQSSGHVAALSTGGFVVVWTDGSGVGGDADITGIKAQRFDADGDKVGGEFLVNTTTLSSQGGAKVTALDAGRFVVTWHDFSSDPVNFEDTEVRAQIFNADGSKSGAEFLVNTQTANFQSGPSITALAGGGFVISWTDESLLGGDSSISSVKAQIYDSTGVRIGSEFLVNFATAGLQAGVTLTALPSGGFAAAYLGDGLNIKVRVFDSAGAEAVAEQNASSGPAQSRSAATVAALDSGFVVTWSERAASGDPDGFDVWAQRFDANGAKVGDEFRVNTDQTGDHRVTDVHSVPGGGFLVTWNGPGTGAGDEIHAQFFDAGGNKVGGEFIVNTVSTGTQSAAKFAILPSGDIVLIWTDTSGTGGDASSAAIRMQILTSSTDAPTDIAISDATLSETAIDNVAVATLSATGAINTSFTYEIVSDSTGGAFRVDGDKLVVDDNDLLDFETDPSAEVRIRATDLNGNSYEETLTLTIADAAVERRYSAGDETMVNADTEGFNGPLAVAPLASGGFAVITSYFVPGGGMGLRARLYDAAGAPAGDEFELDLSERGLGNIQAIGLPSGGFVIVYEGNSISLPGGGNGFPIRAQLFDATGAEVGSDILVSASNDGILSDPSVAILESGGFVVTWSYPQDEPGGSGGPFPSQIRAQLFDADGDKLGVEFRVNTGIEGSQVFSDVRALPGGGFVVTWRDFGSGNEDVEGQFYNAGGVPVGGEFTILSDAINVNLTELIVLESGNLLLTWSEVIDDSGALDVVGVGGQLVGPNGVNIGGPLVLAVIATDGGVGYELAALPGGGFVLSWQTVNLTTLDPQDTDTFAQIFTDEGDPVGDAFPVSAIAGEDISPAQLAVLANGDLVFSYSRGFLDNGADASSVHTRLYSLKDVAGPIVGTPGPDDLTGTAGADTILGLGDDDMLSGLAGNDLLIGGFGADALDGGVGTDTASYADVAAGVSINLNIGQGFGNHAHGDTYTSIENVIGSSLADSIIGDNGDNGLDGGDGDDTLIGSLGADLLAGGEGTDTASYEDNWGGVFVNLDSGQGFGNAAQGDSYTGIENLKGSIFDDFFIGTLGVNMLDGGDGDDILIGSLGADTIVGGNGTDTASYEENWGGVFVNLTLGQGFGNAAQGDTYEGIENLKGGVFGDFFIGNEGVNRLDGAGGNDTLTGSLGGDVLAGGSGSDTASYEDNWGAVFVNLSTGAGNGNAAEGDTYDGVENLRGSIFDDYFIGDAGANILAGGLGNDTLSGAGGADGFLFDTALGGNIDFFTDFVSGTDKILLDHNIFTGLPLGELSANVFSSSGANDGNDIIIYNPGLGFLSFDADGNGPGSAISFAILQPGGSVNASDFVVI